MGYFSELQLNHVQRSSLSGRRRSPHREDFPRIFDDSADYLIAGQDYLHAFEFVTFYLRISCVHSARFIAMTQILSMRLQNQSAVDVSMTADAGLSGTSLMWWIITTIIAGAIALFTLYSKSLTKDVKLPYIGLEYGDLEKRKEKFLHEAEKLLQSGYDQFTNGLFQVATSEGPTVIISRKFIEELKAYPEDTVSFDKRAEKTMMPEYTGCSNHNELGVHVVKSDFTSHLNQLTLIVDDETRYALSELKIDGEEWVSVPMFKKMLRIVSLTSGRTFCQELTRNDEWIALSIGYTMNVFNGANAMKKWPPILRPLVYRWVPELATVHSTKKRAVELIQSVIDDRRKAEKEQGESYEKPTDMLRWLEEKMPTWERKVDIDHITDLELILGFASIHSNTGTMTNILYDLVARPEYIAPIREEIENVLARHNGEFNRFAVDQMWKLDSFMKESMRMTPTNVTMFKRQVLKPITLSDGTHLPKGTFIEIPAAAVARDRFIVAGDVDPNTFDGFRFEKLRHGIAREDAAKYLFATVTVDGGMHFGFGRRACPGRFFTTNLMKLVLSHMIIEYDLKMPEDTGNGSPLVRYENLHVEATNFVDPERTLLMRRRMT